MTDWWLLARIAGPELGTLSNPMTLGRQSSLDMGEIASLPTA
jgi:hypothetical protein